MSGSAARFGLHPRQTGRQRRPVRRSALAILALFLAASGALRLGEGIGTALALAPEEAGGQAPSEPTAATCADPPAVVAAALSERAAQIAIRESALAERLSALALAEEIATRRIAEMRAAEAALSATIARTDGAAEVDVTRLVTIYEAMKPAEAAGVFAAMAPEFAAGFLGAMRPEAAGAILGRMPPDAAYAASALIAGRNAGAPKD